MVKPVGMAKINFVKDQRREPRARRKQKHKKRHFSSMVLKRIRQLGLKQENGISEMAQELEDDTSGVIRLRNFFYFLIHFGVKMSQKNKICLN